MKVIAYEEKHAATWDHFVRASRNGTFLFQRPFMEYHKDRFEDASLLFLDEQGSVRGVFPANVQKNQALVQSHGGLTYGGLILGASVQVAEVGEMWRLMVERFLESGFRRLQYKPIPYIYHDYPSDEDLYWLFRAGAQLESRALSSAVLLHNPLHADLWHRKIKRRASEGLQLHEDCWDRLPEFWNIVCEVLETRHHAKPVHSAEEISLLHDRLPDHVKLFTVTNERDEVITGAVLFVTRQVVHVQYMEAGGEARTRRALDWLIQRLIAYYEQRTVRYFEFGISTERGGLYLNEGLAYQKEGFGGRGVCYDSYLLDLPQASAALTQAQPTALAAE